MSLSVAKEKDGEGALFVNAVKKGVSVKSANVKSANGKDLFANAGELGVSVKNIR
jgi:hypothetical protein